MGGILLAVPRWARDPFYRRVFRGRVLDCGGAGDPFALQAGRWPNVTEVVTADGSSAPAPWWNVDLNDWTPDPESFDCVLSSHTLEHLHDPARAIAAWWDAVKPGGHLLVIVPDWRTYERGIWPSTRNGDHKTAWQLLGDFCAAWDDPPVRSLLSQLPGPMLVRALTLDTDFDPLDPNDQTGTGGCECGLEAVWWKRP